MVAETVLDSATVELSVPVATPLAFVVAAGCVSVFPVPVAASTTVAPWTGLPSASLAVTVIVDVLVPLDAVIGEVAATLDCAPDTVLACTTTVAPAIAFPNPSLAVTVIVDAPVPAAIGDVAATVDCAADTAPGFTTTVAVWVMAIVLIVAEIVFEPDAVDASVPVATPFASVVPAGCVSVFPVPVAARTTVAP